MFAKRKINKNTVNIEQIETSYQQSDEEESPVVKKRKIIKQNYSTKDALNEQKQKQDQINQEMQYKANEGLLVNKPQDEHATGINELTAIILAEDQKVEALRQKLKKQSQDGKKYYTGQKGYNQQHIQKSEYQTVKQKQGATKGPSCVRSTCRMDYNPSLCKDYHDTGYCGFGDSCIYIHDRGDYKTGWELEEEWEKEQKERQQGTWVGSDNEFEEQDKVIVPTDCPICEQNLKDPVMTKCGHFFCEKCALNNYLNSKVCFQCNKPTNGLFNNAVQAIQKLKELAQEKNQNNESDNDDKETTITNDNFVEIQIENQKDAYDLKKLGEEFQTKISKQKASLIRKGDWGL